MKIGSSVTPRAANASTAPSPRSTRQSTRATLPPASVTASSASSVEPPVVVVSSTSATRLAGREGALEAAPEAVLLRLLAHEEADAASRRGIVARGRREHRRDERHRADGHAADGVDRRAPSAAASSSSSPASATPRGRISRLAQVEVEVALLAARERHLAALDAVARRSARAAPRAPPEAASLLPHPEHELRDQLGVQLAGALAELQRLRLEQQPPDLVLLAEPVAAEDLDAVERVLRRRPGSPSASPSTTPSSSARDAGVLHATELVDDVRACCVRQIMSAIFCWISWNSPIFWPNASRSQRVGKREVEAALRLADAARRHREASHVERPSRGSGSPGPARRAARRRARRRPRSAPRPGCRASACASGSRRS